MCVRMRFPTYVSCLVVVAIAGFLLTSGGGRSVARGASGPMPGTGLIRLGGGNWSSLTNTDKYSVMIVSTGNANYAGAQPGRSLMYSCGTNTPGDIRRRSSE
jgi:hypothetical protein